MPPLVVTVSDTSLLFSLCILNTFLQIHGIVCQNEFTKKQYGKESKDGVIGHCYAFLSCWTILNS